MSDRVKSLMATLVLVVGLLGCEIDDSTNITPTEPSVVPTPGFTVNVNGLTVTVTDTSVGAATVSYDWSDGLSDSFSSGSHTYRSAGSFTIVQTVANINGSATASRTVSVGDTDPSPVAAFEIVNVSDLTVSFRDRSTNAVRWEWDFGDGERDTIRSPNHTYRDSGSYTVILTVFNASGDNDRTDQTLTLQDFPVAGFVIAINRLTVTVTDRSTDADDVHYEWGDGASDGFRSGAHTYASAGSYTILQRVTNASGVDELSRTVTVATR
jgi:PKD repeat protein